MADAGVRAQFNKDFGNNFYILSGTGIAVQNMGNTEPVTYDIGNSHITISLQTNTRIRRLSSPEYRTIMDQLEYTPIFERYSAVQKEIDQLASEKDSVEGSRKRGTVAAKTDEIKAQIAFALPYLESRTVSKPHQYGAVSQDIRETIVRVITGARMQQGKKSEDSDIEFDSEV